MSLSFTYNNISSASFQGFVVEEIPPITRAGMRYNKIDIDGLDRTIFEQLGYEAYKKKITFGVVNNPSVLNDIMAWLTGSGTLILSNESDKYYDAEVLDGIELEKTQSLYRGSVSFLVQPYKYKLDEAAVAISGATSVSNIGNVDCLPLISITGTGTVTFSVSGTQAFSLALGTDEAVVIDSEEMECYSGTTLKNRIMTGNFPVLPVGTTEVTVSGTVTSATILPRSRWL